MWNELYEQGAIRVQGIDTQSSQLMLRVFNKSLPEEQYFYLRSCQNEKQHSQKKTQHLKKTSEVMTCSRTSKKISRAAAYSIFTVGDTWPKKRKKGVPLKGPILLYKEV